MASERETLVHRMHRAHPEILTVPAEEQNYQWLAREAFREYRFTFGDTAEAADSAWQSISGKERRAWENAARFVVLQLITK